MHKKRPPIPVIVIILLVVLIGGYYGLENLFTENNSGLSASGSIEAVEVNVSPEMAGKVSEVLVAEGDSVQADSPLLALDPSLLAAQRTVALSQVDSANAALKTAQYQYDLTLQNALIAQQASTAIDWRYASPDEFSQPLWFFLKTEQIDAVEEELKRAETALSDAQNELATIISDLDNTEFLVAAERLNLARIAFLVARDVKIQSEYAAQGGGLRDASYDAYNDAEDELNAAEEAYFDLLNTEAEDDVQDARGKVVVAQQRYDVAYTHLLALQTGEESAAVTSEQNALGQTQSALDQAKANLALLDTQIAKLTIYAPASGTVLTRNVEPGEFVQPGATALTLADLSELKITVYVPEDRYGEISLGQQAEISVDSFPNETFSATVVYIANSAEYTPRNVQTVEGRSSTVYAVKLKVDDPAGKLKPGMPADVKFNE
ncbi:MAG: HlyD family efflux transporter periplasmic adaptor subunit [Anaerolineae bacterium]|jgi:HlyD family secretion protein|nr:HlyD family efflux transporter periplasmic adaptor subunit [Anaerolineae bacterium]MBT3712272.1 HlyD family efflux transporter periplasmic adaptor subunit [Anaerolineae bacterium]MBT4310772.1 HlyD family efflux transporter periplasmic adaptor subunit [Anaerolineae bacterium]MBT4458230.1 HlyD family efflux transporter periplasmic adaptor subunit [Anaerolineae bacterium]MBT4841015.1 HlyD family efflux transporter periplasmic adaptor subunit [Anaerolineae bacterium]